MSFRMIIYVIVILFTPTAWSISNALKHNEVINIVEIANFNCPYCYYAEAVIQPIKTLIEKAGGKFDFIPLPSLNTSEWPSRVMLSAPSIYQNNIRDSLFTAMINEGLTLETVSSTCIYLALSVSGFTSDECIHWSQSNISTVRISKAKFLLDYCKKFEYSPRLPIFIVVQNNTILKVLSRPNDNNINKLAESLLDIIKKALNSEI